MDFGTGVLPAQPDGYWATDETGELMWEQTQQPYYDIYAEEDRPTLSPRGLSLHPSHGFCCC
eukprot:scaffold142899_cov26-Prasinocladus_malaysianus.AAC.1